MWNSNLVRRPVRTEIFCEVNQPRCVWLMCDDEAMTLTGERPSADEAWNVCVAEGNCAAARQGGEQPEANDPAQNSMTMRLNSIRPVRNGEPALAKAKPVAQAMRMASPQRAKAATIRNGRVIGVSEVGKCRRQSHEARAGARRERRGSQSPHSSAETGNDRGAKGDRKVKA
jgi:hypothetical protein